MGCMILIEGLDLSGKSTLVAGLRRRFSQWGWRVSVSQDELCAQNPLAAAAREMIRQDPGFSQQEGTPLFLASHLWDSRNFVVPMAPRHLHLQDSCALRTLAYERVLGQKFYEQRLDCLLYTSDAADE